jgi:hypothetical protein
LGMNAWPLKVYMNSNGSIHGKLTANMSLPMLVGTSHT